MGLVRYYDIAIGYVIVPIFRYKRAKAQYIPYYMY